MDLCRRGRALFWAGAITSMSEAHSGSKGEWGEEAAVSPAKAT